MLPQTFQQILDGFNIGTNDELVIHGYQDIPHMHVISIYSEELKRKDEEVRKLTK